METNNKYWTKLPQYEASAKDPDNLVKFTSDEIQWLYDNLRKIDLGDAQQRLKVLSGNFLGWHGHAAGIENFEDLQGSIIRFEDEPNYSNRYWYLAKYTDDWYYCATQIFYRNIYDGDLIYRCDGFLGLKKLLEQIGLLHKS